MVGRFEVDGVGAREMVKRANWRKLRVVSEDGEIDVDEPVVALKGMLGENVWDGEADNVERKEERKDVAARREPDRR